MKKLLLIVACIAGFLWMYSAFADSDFNTGINFQNTRCTVGGQEVNCLLAGVKKAGQEIGGTGVITGKGIAESVQDFVVYLLSFISIVAVIYVMYAGAQLLLKPASEESAEKTKKIIVSVIVGIVIIWFAWWIVRTIFYVINTGTRTTFIPRAIAEAQIRNIDFTTYSNEIKSLAGKINNGYNTQVISDLETFVYGAYQHLPDQAHLYGNKQLYDDVVNAITEYKDNYTAAQLSVTNGTKYEDKEVSLRGQLQSSLNKFLDVIQESPDNSSSSGIYKIVSHPEATLDRGPAPHSVTFNAKNTIDESGTMIPNDNYIWWLRTGGNAHKEIGRGKIIEYTFDSEGTYSVFLTINSASRNSKGLVDTLSFEDRVTVEVTQPEINFLININDQLANNNNVVKISTKDALKPIRIDASETRFSSGYTTKSTVWDFGNGSYDNNTGDPQLEIQTYNPGEYTIKLTLIRNDGQEFVRSILLKIGDPLASINVPSSTINKGDKAVFQAQKTSNELDVRYTWEVKKQGKEPGKEPSLLYSFSGTRLEYVFGDTGQYFISLTSTKGDARDKDTIEVNIESRPPNVQFTTEVLSPELPNVYTFDATNSFDPDYPDNQKLRFEWFINDVPIQLTETNSRNSRGKYTFLEKGTHYVGLRVTDDEGKSREIKNEIKVNKILSVKIDIRPFVIKRGEKVLLLATTPGAKIYEWRVAGNEPQRTENNRFVTSLPTAGVFPVSVTVTNAEGEVNTATSFLYVQDNDQPFAIIDIKSDSSLSISQKSSCSDQEAITVDRANSVYFSAGRSVNKDGKNNDLTYLWRIGLNKTSNQPDITYTFDELGCEEIILTVADRRSGASYTTKTWVKVVNLAPVFSDITVDEGNIDMDPVKINLKLTGAKDPDGLIHSYTWYYYTDKDDQPQGFRITRVPETSFVLPKITGRYYFAVLMEDSNGLKINTKEKNDKSYSTTELYSNTNLSTPIIENFEANATEVKFGDLTRLSLAVRTPVATNVTDASEYRWDIDGDGFYDVKTTTPFYEFSYIYPGEYNPKVKVTHKGISSTKSLTIVVKNALIPKANIHMMGNKIIAYNVSSGVFQSANWYLDGVKISDNKDYLISEIEGSKIRNLKLEISDGKTTESAVYSIQPSTKNNILLKKIKGSLVILSSLNESDVEEAPDDITWTDPMTPLFLYLGESRGDIGYYIIDTDIDIDTDLSGGKADDADNKGTASYKHGRPFQIPKGTKRVTVMKIGLIGNNSQELATRQIRVTRTFLANTETELIPDSKAPKIFNLSQEDKDRIDRLRNLIQSAPPEEKDEFNKILDQLSDNWYDVAERIQTLNLFSNRVNESPTLSADLKKKILEQISIVYTQGDNQIQEKQLALKMITEYLAKSTKKVQIFGDADKPGLINEIIDSPEYYEANLKVIQKIMDEYVDPDKTLSDAVKKDIREKLMILAGSPPAPPEQVITEKEDTSSNGKMVLFLILGGVMLIILGIVSIIYVRKKLNPHTEKEDTPGNTKTSENTASSVTDSSPTPSTDAATTTPDWLKEDASTFSDEDVFSAEPSATSDVQQPDWLQDAATTPVIAAENVETEKQGSTPEQDVPPPEVAIPPVTAPDAETEVIPDWLQESTETPMETTESPVEIQNPEPVIAIQDIPSPETVSSNEVVQEDDIPDWLRGSDNVTEADTDASLENASVLTDSEPSPEDISLSVKEEVLENDGKKSEIETIEEQKEELLESPAHLLEGTEDALIAPPKKEKAIKKKATPRKTKTVSSDHLLTSEHDMLLPPHTSDNTL